MRSASGRTGSAGGWGFGGCHSSLVIWMAHCSFSLAVFFVVAASATQSLDSFAACAPNDPLFESGFRFSLFLVALRSFCCRLLSLRWVDKVHRSGNGMKLWAHTARGPCGVTAEGKNVSSSEARESCCISVPSAIEENDCRKEQLDLEGQLARLGCS